MDPEECKDIVEKFQFLVQERPQYHNQWFTDEVWVAILNRDNPDLKNKVTKRTFNLAISLTPSLGHVVDLFDLTVNSTGIFRKVKHIDVKRGPRSRHLAYFITKHPQTLPLMEDKIKRLQRGEQLSQQEQQPQAQPQKRRRRKR